MADIEISGGPGTFQVELRDGGRTSSHVVTVPSGLAESLGWDGGDAELVRASFAFLLEREPPSSILRRFSLEVIGDYFPEYRAVMARRP